MERAKESLGLKPLPLDTDFPTHCLKCSVRAKRLHAAITSYNNLMCLVVAHSRLCFGLRLTPKRYTGRVENCVIIAMGGRYQDGPFGLEEDIVTDNVFRQEITAIIAELNEESSEDKLGLFHNMCLSRIGRCLKRLKRRGEQVIELMRFELPGDFPSISSQLLNIEEEIIRFYGVPSQLDHLFYLQELQELDLRGLKKEFRSIQDNILSAVASLERFTRLMKAMDAEGIYRFYNDVPYCITRANENAMPWPFEKRDERSQADYFMTQLIECMRQGRRSKFPFTKFYLMLEMFKNATTDDLDIMTEREKYIKDRILLLKSGIASSNSPFENTPQKKGLDVV